MNITKLKTPFRIYSDKKYLDISRNALNGHDAFLLMPNYLLPFVFRRPTKAYFTPLVNLVCATGDVIADITTEAGLYIVSKGGYDYIISASQSTLPEINPGVYYLEINDYYQNYYSEYFKMISYVSSPVLPVDKNRIVETGTNRDSSSTDIRVYEL